MLEEDSRARFAVLASGEDASVELDEAALLVAAEYCPAVDLAAVRGQLDDLAQRALARLPTAADDHARLDALVETLASDAGFRGNTREYRDPRNSFLNEVLTRRRGIPITLSVVYIEVARRIGLRLVGVSFPGHFLVRYPGPATPLILDAFSAGQKVSEATLVQRLCRGAHGGLDRAEARHMLSQLLDGASVRQIVVRMLGNLKAIYLEQQDHERALVAVDRILLLAPDEPSEVWARAVLHHRLEAYRAALADYRRYLDLMPEDPDGRAIREIIVDLTRRVEQLH
jgi:regulator of sirC expression with transglutaminase-like and TPR domain